jgi:processive 1,2-diacylglycerol beta-glucosyltransferase
LVLTSSTGGGHDTRAQAFAEWCFQLYRYQVDVRIEQMLEESSSIYRGGVNFYNWIQRRSPWMHKAFYTVVEGLSLLNRRTVILGRRYYERVLRARLPQPRVFPARAPDSRTAKRALRHLLRRVLRRLGV